MLQRMLHPTELWLPCRRRREIGVRSMPGRRQTRMAGRKRRLRIAAVALAAVAATRSPAEAATHSEEIQIRDAEARLAEAFAHADTAALTGVFTDNYLFVDIAGRVHDRDERLTSAAAPTTACDSVHLHGHVAIVVGHGADTRVMRVWVQQGALWRVASEQAVAIQPGAVEPTVSFAVPPVHDERGPDFSRGSVVADVLRAQDALDRANALRDPATFSRLTHPDVVVVTSHGLVRTKADRVVEEQIARLERQPERPMPRRDDVRLNIFGSAAIVIARNWPRAFDGAPRAPTRNTRVWMKGPGGWQQVASITTWVLH
jgi:ketosteroid isomerase-like protein